MDAASENSGRGRPRKFDPQELDRHFAGRPDAPRTLRRRQDRVYAERARVELRQRYGDDDRLDWLVGRESTRWSILVELGRGLRAGAWRGPKFEVVVEWVLSRRPLVKDAEMVLRSLRHRRRLSEVPANVQRPYRDLLLELDAFVRRSRSRG